MNRMALIITTILVLFLAQSVSSAARTDANILVDLSTETLSVDGIEHEFGHRLTLPRGGWDVEFFVQPFIPNSQVEDGFIYFGIENNNPNTIVFATNSNMTTNLLMLPPGGGSGGGDKWNTVDGVVYSRMRHKDSSSNAWDNVSYIHFNVYATSQTTFTIHYKAGPIPNPPYTPILYPGFAHIRATSLGN